MTKFDNNRILYLDYARTIALFLVVFAHLYSVDSSVKLYVYAFHMPFFFIVSGMLHRDSDYIPLIEKMIKRMIIPFFFFLFLGYLYCAISSQSLALGTAYGSIVGVVMGKDIVANDILWFFIAMFWVRIIGNWLIRIPRIVFPLSVLVSFVFYYIHINYLYLGTSLMALPFYLLGNYIKTSIHRIVNNKRHLLLSIFLLAFSVVVSNYNGKVSMMGCSFGNTPSFLLSFMLFYLNGIVGSLVILCLVGRVEKCISWLLQPSYCAISIVGLQFIPIMIWYRSIGFNHNYVISCVYSLMIITVCILFHIFVGKHANWLLGGK